jgi:hypothetical protein
MTDIQKNNRNEIVTSCNGLRLILEESQLYENIVQLKVLQTVVL